MASYRHRVDVIDPRVLHHNLYDGVVAADAMAAWSKAISDGVEYVTLESLEDTRPEKDVHDDVIKHHNRNI